MSLIDVSREWEIDQSIKRLISRLVGGKMERKSFSEIADYIEANL